MEVERADVEYPVAANIPVIQSVFQETVNGIPPCGTVKAPVV